MIQNLTYGISEVADHFHVEPLDIQRYAALGLIEFDTVDSKQVVLHENLVRAIPRLSSAPMGIRRDRNWFHPEHLPKSKTRYHAAVKGASEDQMLSRGEVEARSNSRTKGMEIALVFNNEIRDAIGAPWKSGLLRKVEDSIGKSSEHWQPTTIMTGYIAECLIKLIERKTASSLSNLYKTKSAFDATVSEVVNEFLIGDFRFTDNVQSMNLSVTVIYALANRSAFTREQVERVAGWIF